MSTHVRSRGSSAAVDSLVQAGAVDADADTASWTAVERDALRWKLVGWRDQGQRDEAETALRHASSVWPEDPVFLLELLVLQLATPSLDLAAELAQSPPEALRHPEVALLLAFQASRAGNPASAADHFRHIGDLPPNRMGPLAGLYREALDLAAMPVAQASYVNAAAGAADPLALPEAAALIEVLARSLVHADRYEDLANYVRAQAYFNVFQVPLPLNILLRAFEKARPLLSVAGRTTEISLVLATLNETKAAPLVLEVLNDDRSRRSSYFARVAGVVAARLKDGALERQVLVRAEAPADPSFAEAARWAEIESRRHRLGADRPLRVFVGFFGQMREPDAVLPEAVEVVRRAFADDRYGACELSFALSTWEKAGGRPLSLDDAAGFFAQAAPPEVRPLLTAANGTTGRDLAVVMPNLIQALSDHHGRNAGQTPALDDLRRLLPPASLLVVDPELTIERDIQSGLERLDMNHPPIANQLKMWSRIAGLRQAMEQHEATRGAPFDVCLLIRCDLANLHGSLASFAARAASSYEAASLFHDHDQHAEFIEGSGDRYMLGSRATISALFDGFDHYVGHVLQDAPSALAGRLHAHISVQSLIFLRGLTPAPVWAMGYELHRGAPPLAIVEKALAADAEASPDAAVRDQIRTALTDVRNRIAALQTQHEPTA